jgi:hypothetical protein
LLFLEEHVQGTGIAGFDQDAHAGKYLQNAPGTGARSRGNALGTRPVSRGDVPGTGAGSRLELVQVSDQVVGAALVPDQAVGLLGFVHERWSHPAPGPLLVADETVYLAALQ